MGNAARTLIAATVLFVAAVCRADVIDVYPEDDLFGILENLNPGDEVVVHAGTYTTQSASGNWFRAL